ncbi:MAG: hypothetical protein CME32_05655 [Gimesia sp.]|nr:hypothetical protein [Gimesia sp.]
MMEQNDMLMAKIGQDPKFAQLRQIATEIGSAQMDALTHKHSAVHAEISTQLTQMSGTLHSQALQANSLGLKDQPKTSQEKASDTLDNESAKAPLDNSNSDESNGGLGSSDPDANNGSSNGLGSSAPYSDPSDSGVGSDPSDNPSDWDPSDMNSDVLSYDREMFHLFDMLQSSQMNNPQALIQFVIALSKMAGQGGAMTPSGSSYASHYNDFSQSLANLPMPQLNGFFSGCSNMGQAMGFAIAAAALYQAKGNAGNAQGIINQIVSQMGTGSGLLGQIRDALTGNALSQVSLDMPSGWTSLKDGGKQMISNIMESLGYAIQDNFDAINKAYMQSYIQSILVQFKDMEHKGASLTELMNYVMMSYDQVDDNAGSYAIPIDDLGGAGNSISTMMQAFTPTGLDVSDQNRSSSPYYFPGTGMSESQQDQASNIFDSYISLDDEWQNAPSLTQGGSESVGNSIATALAKMGAINLGAVGGIKSQHFTAAELATLKSVLGKNNVSMQQLVRAYKNAGSQGDKSKQELLRRFLFCGLDLADSTTTTGSSKVPQPNALTQDAVNSLQTVQSQISSVNQSTKARFTNANQTSANLLSTDGGIMKNLLKIMSSIVQNEKF